MKKTLALLALLFATPALAASGHFLVVGAGTDSLAVSPCSEPESLVVNTCGGHRMVAHLAWTGPSSGAANILFTPHLGWSYSRSQLQGGTYTITCFYSWEFGPGAGCTGTTTVGVPFLPGPLARTVRPFLVVDDGGGGSCTPQGVPPRPRLTATSN